MSQQKSVIDLVDEQLAQDGNALPVLDAIAVQLQQMLSNSEVDVGRVTRLISSEPSLSAELLRVSNSSRFRGLEKTTTLRDAMMRLGTRQVAGLALMASQKGNFRSSSRRLQQIMNELWRHAVACAIGARWLATKCGCASEADAAFLGGLLHDAGKLLLLRVVDEMLSDGNGGSSVTEALLMELLETFHAEKGAALLRKWELPERHCEIALKHHAADAELHDPVLAIVRLVDQACHKLGIGLTRAPDVVLATLPESHALGLSEIALAELEILLEDALEAS